MESGATIGMNRPEIENEFESFVSKSKSYIDTRDREELDSLKTEIDELSRKLSAAFEDSRQSGDVNYVAALKLMSAIINKFNDSVDLMENLQTGKPLLQEFDTRRMLDVILPNIKCLVEYDNWRDSLDPEKLEKDCMYVELLEDQHKRILLTYLMQDWKNMEEVLNLIKIGELYKNIAEKLVSLSLLSLYIEKND